ncbi:unnamed protein product [Caenorhabditis bovis]|uniref:Immunoglobulin-binding protein 1 n=1 Tax=Caenorhabditis bovis TaxID=2654633 RepID=A0A8S1EQC9_9PELO|nr:unnamed protein product [Caenorhabditis bovis]
MDEHDDEISLTSLFDSAHKFVSDIESGAFTTPEIQPRLAENIANLETLTILVNKLGLFSSNELIDDVPTASLRYLLIPCYLGVLHQNTMAEPKTRLDALRKSKIYYRNFLERLRNLGLIDYRLPWVLDEEEAKNVMKLTAEENRRQKLERHRKKKELKECESQLCKQLQAMSVDEGNVRDLYLTQLRYWIEKAFEELQSIDEELPLLKMIVRGATRPDPPKQPTRAPMKPFVITRDAQQKAVFGLGYPSIPTMTVDEWYQEKFGCHGGPASASQPSAAAAAAEGSDHSDGEDEDAKRARLMQWDEYKDTHRRGWGNTHNKG